MILTKQSYFVVFDFFHHIKRVSASARARSFLSILSCSLYFSFSFIPPLFPANSRALQNPLSFSSQCLSFFASLSVFLPPPFSLVLSTVAFHVLYPSCLFNWREFRQQMQQPCGRQDVTSANANSARSRRHSTFIAGQDRSLFRLWKWILKLFLNFEIIFQYLCQKMTSFLVLNRLTKLSARVCGVTDC